MEWDNDTKYFKPMKPNPLPEIKIRIKLHENKHEETNSRKTAEWTTLRAVADTGCQTCTAGMDLIKQLCCPISSLIKTRHRIVGITDTLLDNKGAILADIQHERRQTRQMIHISANTSGLYLSETALRDLALIDKNFPHHKSHESRLASAKTDICNCPQRTPAPKRPQVIPFKPTRENIPKLKAWLLDTFASSVFNTYPHQTLQVMSGAEVDVRFKSGAVPVAVHTPIPIPHHWKSQVKDDIERDVRLGIIEPVPQGTLTTWCSRMVVTAKKDGSPRRTVDLQQLNKATLRETHHTPSPFNTVAGIPKNTYKTVVDAWNGYHSLSLSDTAKEATTFITEWGRFRYRRAPMGFHASGDAYTRRFDDITNGFERVKRIVDDSIMWDDTIETSFWHTYDYLFLCSNNGIVFNPEKFAFAEETVDFAGFQITPDSIRPPKRIIDAIRNFPTPKNLTDIHSWFGLVNQVAYTFAQTAALNPFRELLSSKKKQFYWDETMTTLFESSKEEIIRLTKEGIKSFEMKRTTCLSTDWSRNGIGFTLMQKQCTCRIKTPVCGPGHWKLILAGSRFTKPSESRYAPIEGEALGVTYGLNQCKMFILGCPDLIVAVDHKPLIKILNDRSLESIENPRLRILKEKTLMYRFDIVHVKGEANLAADAASRYPSHVPRKPQDEIEDSSLAFAIHQSSSIKSISWADIKDASIADEEMQNLKRVIAEGFPKTRNELPEQVRSYWPMRDELYNIDGIPMKGRKLLIPKALRSRVAEGLHAAHQGINSMKANARERFFWPGLDAALVQVRAQCRQCTQNAPSQRSEPLMRTDDPEVPFQQTVIDLFELEGHHFCVYADRYSGWIEVSKIVNGNFRTIKQLLLKWFAAFGVPEEMSTDGGPPFNSADFKALLETWNVRHRLSSAYYPKSNGRAEVAVKSIKRTLQGTINKSTGELDTNAAIRALLTHRNTPNQDTDVSPAIALYGFPLRDHLPQPRTFRREWKQILEAREKALAKRHLRSQEWGHPLTRLSTHDSVAIQNQHGNKPLKWHNTGTIVEVLPNRQYKVVIDGSRRITLRNRKFLRKIDPICRTKNIDPPYDPPQATDRNIQVTKQMINPRNCGTDDTHPTQDMPSKQAEPPHCEAIAEGTIDQRTAPSQSIGYETPQLRAGNVVPEPEPIRRSSRTKKKPLRLIEEEG